jgi:hypothetical protein
MNNGNLIKENGFFFLNTKIIYHSMQVHALFTIYFIGDYMVYEMDIVKGKINLDHYLFEAKYKRRRFFEEKLYKENAYSPFTNIRRNVGLFKVKGTEIECSYIGENSDRPNVHVLVKRMWLPLFGTDYYLNVHDERSNIVKVGQLTFCSYP